MKTITAILVRFFSGLSATLLIAFFSLAQFAQASSVYSPAVDYDGSFAVSWSCTGGDYCTIFEEVSGQAAHTLDPFSSPSTRTLSDGVHKYWIEECTVDGSNYPQPPTTTCVIAQTRTTTVVLEPNPPGSIGFTNISEGTTDHDGWFTVSWGESNSSNITHYDLQQEKNGSGSWVSVTVDPDSGLQHTINPSLTSGTYRYRVRAKRSVGFYEHYSAQRTSPITISVSLLPSAPGAFTQPVTNPVSDTSFTLSWSEGSSNTEYYVLQQSSNGTDFSDYPDFPSSFPDTNFIASVAGDGEYYYRVLACNSHGCNTPADSPIKMVSVNVPLQAPEQVVFGTVPESSDFGDFDISWLVPAGAVTGYQLVEVINGVEQQPAIDLTSMPPNTYEARGKAAGHYQYKLKACNTDVCNTEWSTSAPITVSNLENIVPVVSLSSDTVAGNMRYGTHVNRLGDAIIGVPIQIPSGVNGVQPTLSLAFSSGRGRQRTNEKIHEDILGYGWRVNGFSEIRRCHKNTSLLGVTFTDLDSLCLDGEPLVLITGTAWQPGAIYRTLHDQFVKIELKGTSSEPWFEVADGTGGVIEYGNTDDSMIRSYSHPAGFSPYFAWTVNKQMDIYGNEVRYKYHMDVHNGFNYPLYIEYGNNLDARIDFEYASRDDAQPMPLAEDYRSLTRVLLHHITVSLDNKPLREYRLVSEVAPEGWRRLGNIQLCGFDLHGQPAECLNSLNFNWFTPPGENPLDFKTAVNQVIDSLGRSTIFEFTMMTENTSAGVFSEHPFGEASYPPFTTNTEPVDGLLRCVVDTVRRDNGIAGEHVTTYAYQGKGVVSTKGWGFQGYFAQRIRNEQNGITTYKQFRMDYPYIGRVAQIVQYDSLYSYYDKIISKQSNQFSFEELDHGGSSTIFSFAEKTSSWNYEQGVLIGLSQVERSFATSSGLLSRAETITRFASTATFSGGSTLWGDVQDVSLVGVARSSKSSVDYEHRISGGQWLVGFPEASVASVYDGEVSISPDRTIEASAQPYQNTMKTGVVTRFPGSALYELSTSFSFNSQGNPLTETTVGAEVDSRTTTVQSYVDKRYPQTVLNALGHQITLEYDPRFGSASRTLDANGLETSIAYDSLGRPIAITDSNGTTDISTYKACSTIVGCPLLASYRVQTDSPISPKTNKYYDVLGRLIRTEYEAFSAGQSVVQDTFFDEHGRVERVTNPYFEGESIVPSTYYSYDLYNRVKHVAGPDGATTTIEFSVDTANNNEVVVESSSEILTADGSLDKIDVGQRRFNHMGDLLESVNAVGTADEIATLFTYDSSGSVIRTRIDNAPSTDTVIAYDQVSGYRSSITGPNTGTVTMTHNALGQLATQVDNKGQLTTFAYDLLGRVVTRADEEGFAEWTYDPINAIGALSTRSYGNFSETFIYNSDARLETINTQITGANFVENYQHSYGYDSYGRAERTTYPGGMAVNYVYSSKGYMESLVDFNTGATLKTFNEVNAFGQVERETYGNSVQTLRTFNPETGRLESIATQSATAFIQSNFYGWKSNGVLESRLLDDHGVSKQEFFDYDDLNRLRSAETYFDAASVRTLSTLYDRLGNITAKTSTQNADKDVTGYVYGDPGNLGNNAGPHAVSEVVIDGEAYTLSYDANGAITHYAAANDDDKWIVWNSRQLPKTVTVINAVGTIKANDRFEYGPEGQRYYKQSQWLTPQGQLKTEHTFYVGAFEETILVNDPDYKKIQKTLLDQNIQEVRTTDLLDMVETKLGYLHRDHLGSIEKITDENGAQILTTAFEPFGGRRSPTWNSSITTLERIGLLANQKVTTNRGFTDHEHLDRTGLIHMNGRIYDPQLGRFLSPDPFVVDPADSQSYNRYSYVRNNPLSAIDPSGYTEDDPNVGTCNNQNAGNLEECTHQQEQSQGCGQGGCPNSRNDSGIMEEVVATGSPIPSAQSWQIYNAGRWSQFGNIAINFSNMGLAGGALSTGFWLNMFRETRDISDEVNAGYDLGWARNEVRFIMGDMMARVRIADTYDWVAVSSLVRGGVQILQKVTFSVEKGAGKFVSGQGFNSFSALKRSLGPAGKGRAWHHIVEQTPGNIKKFGANNVHNTGNVVNIPHGRGLLHQKISGFYSSKQPFTNGQTVRQWISGKSFNEQYDFGIKILNQFKGS